MDSIHGVLLGLTVLDGREQEQAAARTSPSEPQASPRKPVVN